MTTFNFLNFVVDKSEILEESQRGTFSHLTNVRMSVRDSKNYPKSMVKYLAEDREVSSRMGYDCLSKRGQRSQECMLYLDLGYSDLFVIITVVFSC